MQAKSMTILVLALIATMIAVPDAINAQQMSPSLEDRLFSGQTDQLVNIVVFLEHNESSPALMSSQSGLSRSARIRKLTRDLPQQSGRNALEVESFLSEHSQGGFERFWIVPSYAVTISLDKVDELAALDGVSMIVEDAPLSYDPPVENTASSQLSTGISDQLNAMQVPSLWKRGLKGAGRLVCSFDTGVEQSHPALASKWRGNHTELSTAWFSKVMPDTLPYDRAAHGTHTMGIMVGAMEADSFGVAPEAEWITAGVIDQGRPLQTTFSDIIEAFQWSLNPDGDVETTDDVPDVILNSWGVPKGIFAPCDETFTDMIDVVEAAGIVTIFAAGNEGPDPMTLRNPADFAGTPLSAFAVGAVDNNKLITSFSSRGPSSCNQNELKPEVVAFGYQIRSSQKGGGFAIMSGTSMAAPYIAGLVALMRQYNPEATVEQIKNALILATEDLGPQGEDNTYGHGFVDASRVLEYLPSPAQPELVLASKAISGDGVAMPGETVGLAIILSNVAGNVAQVVGHLSIDSDLITLMNSETTFDFGFGGTIASSAYPFTFTVDNQAVHGSVIMMNLDLTDTDGNSLGSLGFDISLGIVPPGDMETLATDNLEFTATDFGQFGLGQGSIYPADGVGFRVNGGANLLYESGVVIGRNALQISSSIRDSLGGFAVSDFTPMVRITKVTSTEATEAAIATYDDRYSQIPIPVTIAQNISTYDVDGDYIIIDFTLHNTAIERLTDINFAFFADIDLSEGNDSFVFDQDMMLLYQRSETGLMAGVMALENVTSFKALANEAGKHGFTRGELYEMISDNQTEVDSRSSIDGMFFACSRSFDMAPYDSAVIAFAIVTGNDEAELYHNAMTARNRYQIATSVDDQLTHLIPDDMKLHQNYPNPFNPTTTISFELNRSQMVTLEVFNSIGQKVITLANGSFEAGYHKLNWNSTDTHGRSVGSGVYFYRITTDSGAMSRKMILLK